MYKHTFYYFLGNKKYPEIYILQKQLQLGRGVAVISRSVIWLSDRELDAGVMGEMLSRGGWVGGGGSR